MSVRSILKGVAGWFGGERKSASGPGGRRASLVVEGLEERAVPIYLGGSPAAAFLSSGGNFGALNPAFAQPAYGPYGGYYASPGYGGYGQPSYSPAPMVLGSLGGQYWVARNFGGPIGNAPAPSGLGGFGTYGGYNVPAPAGSTGGIDYNYAGPFAKFLDSRAAEALAATGNRLTSQYGELRTPTAALIAGLNGSTSAGAPAQYAAYQILSNGFHFGSPTGFYQAFGT
jgi:hypothetical protein